MGRLFEWCVLSIILTLTLFKRLDCFQCVARDHYKFPCGAGKDHTHPMSMVDRALIMGLAVMYERESGYPWSLTHRPTHTFQSCFPVEPLPSPDDKMAFLNAVQDIVQRGIARFTIDWPEEKVVSERIRAPLEGLLGWHDFLPEDGSYNKHAHSQVSKADGDSSTDIEFQKPIERKKIIAPTLRPVEPPKAPSPSASGTVRPSS